MTASTPATLQAVLEARLERAPDATACFIVDADGDSHRVSISALLGRASAFARQLAADRDTTRPVAVCLYHGLDLFAAFLGAAWAGRVPTMIAPPSPRMEAAKYSRSFTEMLRHIRPSHVVMDSESSTKLASLSIELGNSVSVLECSKIAGSSYSRPELPTSPDDTFLLQHSSGTTGLQKGVALSHRAILSHSHEYARQIRLREDDVIVSWLPLYHDMGLIACFMLPLVEGIPFCAISPFDWVRRPALLLEKLQEHRGTLCWLPNFAYSFLADSVPTESLRDLDLSAVRLFVNCSEPAMSSSHQSFLAKFSSCGVRAEQLTVSYAMAENVFAVTQTAPGPQRTLVVDREAMSREQRIAVATNGAVLVSAGPPLGTTQLKIGDGNGLALDENRIGEILIRGEHLFSGYWNQDQATRAAFTEDGWFRTGDLGFVNDGDVFVTGRKKDLIIIQGRNFYPGDIEAVGAQVSGAVAGRVVAFGLPDARSGTERLIVLAEVEATADPRQVAAAIRRGIAQQLDCTASEVRIVPARWLVKSTSGKLARNDNARKYELEYARPADE